MKEILEETYPIRPGQEARAWTTLQDRLNAPSTSSALLAWPRPLWLGATTALVLTGLFLLFPRHQVYMASADSPLPGISASSFYSDSAQAQVVWLEGMGPASEAPTAQDPTNLSDSSTSTDSIPDSSHP